MTTFDNREQSFETRFVLDQEQEFKASARRNRLIGLWAADLMGLEGDHREDYARAVVKSEVEVANEENVLRKIAKDLAASGLSTSETAVRGKMDEFLAVAREEIRAGE